MREARLARAQVRPAADDRRGRGAVMRRAEGRQRDERLLSVDQPGDRMDPRHLERGLGVERRQDPRQPAPQHRLSRSGRPAEEEIMAARRCQLERAAGAFLAADIGEVGRRRRTVAVRRQRRLGLQLELAAQVGRGLREVVDRDCGDTRERGFPGGVGRAEEPLDAESTRAFGDGEHAADAPEPPVECELPHRRRALQSLPWQLLEAASNASAIGRSKPEPSLRSSAGARLTVMRPVGKLSSAAEIPLLTRSRASWQARSARPTMAKPGMPSRTWASTSTRRGSSPTSA